MGASNDPTSTPVELTSFVGRAEVIRAGLIRLEGARLLTLVGPGGVGKTRLAGRLVRALGRTGRKAQVRWCTLTGVPDGADEAAVERAVAEALGVEIVTEHSARLMILDHLAELERGGPVVLVLDNCEHVVAAVGALVSAVLGAGGSVQILATSREGLGCAGEELFDVPPLWRAEALELFKERAQAVGVVIQAAEDDAAAQLCSRLDGLPLAIELAAAGLRSQSVSEILGRLDGDRFRLLTGGPRHGAHPMHHSIRAAVEWSYRLCSETERALWARLSVFESGWDLAAAEAVGSDADLPTDDVLQVLTELVGKSIVTADRSDGTTRYRMLETLRQYGYAQLADPAAQCRRHREYFRVLTREAAAGWYSAREVSYLQRAHTDLPNLRAAIAWSAVTPGEGRAGLELAVNLARLRLQFYVGNSGETIEWLRNGLPAAGTPALRLWAVTLAGVTALAQGDLDTADEMLELSRTGPVPDDDVAAGLVALLEGLYAFFAEGKAESIAVLRDSVTAFEKAGPRYQGERAMALLFAGMAADWYGTAEEAQELTGRYAADTTAAGAEWAFAWALLVCGLAVIWHGDPNSLPPIPRPKKEPGDHWGLMYLTHLVAWAATATIKQSATPDRATAIRVARALGGAARLRERYRVAISVLPPFRDANLEAERVAIGVLGPAVFEETFRAAHALTYDDIAALAASEDPGDPALDVVDETSAWAGLTATEQDVARLAAEGLSDAQIARRRVCSVRTVEKHLENVRRKLMVESRHGIGQWIPRRD
ncbi:ATP-binding protein [Kribbella sp. NPDC056951]|uniref:ATP-binding protein n=1 Tax=Kribbella sp. NPDC056951 TaxID=3345978 RepID=UPI003641391D